MGSGDDLTMRSRRSLVRGRPSLNVGHVRRSGLTTTGTSSRNPLYGHNNKRNVSKLRKVPGEGESTVNRTQALSERSAVTQHGNNDPQANAPIESSRAQQVGQSGSVSRVPTRLNHTSSFTYQLDHGNEDVSEDSGPMPPPRPLRIFSDGEAHDDDEPLPPPSHPPPNIDDSPLPPPLDPPLNSKDDDDDHPPTPPPRPNHLFSPESTGSINSQTSKRSNGSGNSGLGRRLRSMFPKLSTTGNENSNGLTRSRTGGSSFSSASAVRSRTGGSSFSSAVQSRTGGSSFSASAVPELEPLGPEGQRVAMRNELPPLNMRGSIGQRARRIFRGRATNAAGEEEEAPPKRPAKPVVPGSAIVFDGEALPPRFEETHGLVHIGYLPGRPNIVDAVATSEVDLDADHPVADVARQSSRSLIPPMASEASERHLEGSEAVDAVQVNHHHG